jgi:hypothetical protein
MGMDARTASDIDSAIHRLLAEMLVREPPLILDDVFSHLSLDHGYYNLADPGLLRDVWHQIRIGPSQLVHIVKKIDLRGLWLPDRNKVLVDETIPDLKKRWTNAHEIGHRIIPAHSSFFLGDTAETLHPEYQHMLEEEANYAASTLLFLNQHFTTEARDAPLTIAGVKALSKRYGNSCASTLRRFVERGRDISMLGVISKPRWQAAVGESSGARCRYLIQSPLFTRRFGTLRRADVVTFIDSYAQFRRGGPVGEGEVTIPDLNGTDITFEVSPSTTGTIC